MDEDLMAALRGQAAPKAAPEPSTADLTSLVSRKAKQYGIPEDYAQRWAGKESGWDRKAVSPKGAGGLVQLMPDTAKEYGVKDVNDPEQNVDGGARYLRDLYKKYGSWDKAFAAYNAGPGAVDKAGGIPNYPETQDYVKHIVGGGDQQVAAVDPDLMAALRGEGGDEKGSIPLAEPSEGATTSAKPGQTVTKAQESTFIKLQKTLDQSAAKGSVKNPFAQVVEGEIPEEPGAYYVALDGQLKRTPGGDTYPEDLAAARKSGDGKKMMALVDEHQGEIKDAFLNRFVSGALLGGKNEAGAIATHPIDFVTKGGLDAPSIQATIRDSDARDAVQHARHPIASDAGAISGALGGGLALSALTGGGADLPFLAKLGFSAGEGAAVGGAQGFLGADGTAAERVPEAKEGAKFGAMLGPASEIAGEAGHFAGKKLLGLAVSKETAELAKKAKDEYGINLRGGQIANSHFVKFMDSVLNRTPGTGYAAKSADQSQAFTRAVAKTFGEDADGLTPQVMAQAKKRIGNEFDRVGAATTVKDAAKLGTDLDGIVQDAGKVLAASEVKSLEGQVKDIKTAFKDVGGNLELSGESYQALTRKGTPLDRLTQSGDPNVRHYAQAIKDELLNAVQRNASADDVKALKLARKQYAKMKTLEPLAEKAGPEGEISPALLLQALRSNYDNLAYDGGGDLGDLSKIGQRFLKEPSSSGTAERLAAHNLLKFAGGAAGGGGALWLLQHPEEAGKVGLGAGALALGTLAAGKGAAGILDNPAYRKLLLRSAKAAPAVVGKGKTPLLTAPRVLGPATGAQLSNRFVSEPSN